MESKSQPLNLLALTSLACGLLSPLVFLGFVMIGALQEIGHSVFVESYRYERLARLLMLGLSAAAIFLSYRAKVQIQISNGAHRGTMLAQIGRILGYTWGTAMLVAVLLWGF